ncbi:TetR/AcrR family transcriptional regulator [Lactococcus kimchii]|uniref:TetR/AcrR family transcriptional regulator n=1 Tax=Lactococcus sp. S-13 TaxID=2507158 RepID=UPI001023AB89|nr:TetR/AcrR family transcriptional regulator [Lactococcus sp. S-13]RZI48365.1 TetR/AcrR family transcriptional regulator [Lactococcus sp. S-13]
MSETKNRILAVATQLFCEKGYHATSVRDVMEATKASKSQFYYYFPAKKDLVLAVIDRHFTQWKSECFEGILQKQNNPDEALEAMLDWIYQSHVNQLTHYGCPVGNLIIELAANDAESRAALQAFYGQWIALLTEKFTALQVEKPNIQAQQLIAGIQGSILLLKLSQDLTVLKDNFDELKIKIAQMKLSSTS